MQTVVAKNSAAALSRRDGDRLSLPPTFFDVGPTRELTLDQFECLAIDRLQLLRSIEMLKARGFEDKELAGKIREAEKKHIRASSKSSSVYAGLSDSERDCASHFILRLAYCRTEDLRRWFLMQETLLFKTRLEYLTDDEKQDFMAHNGLHFKAVSSEDKNAREHKLKGLSGVTDNNFYATVFYEVPFLEALQLIAPRQVYLERGKAYIPFNRLLNIITVRFRQNLSHALTVASTCFDGMTSGDVRILPFLKNMSKQFIGSDFSQRSAQSSVDKLTSPEQVAAAAAVHFPLCMRHLHNGLLKDHKLKHWGRLQYTLFLKGCGMDLDGAVAWMQAQFTQVMSTDQFVKTYAYSFRHMFGKEGARRNYTPYSCMKIIMGNPPEPGAYHGCAFKHAPDSVLVNLLTQEKLSPDSIREIVTLAKQGSAAAVAAGAGAMSYQLACQRHFDITHPDHLVVLQSADARSEAVAQHPNQWFQASVQYHRLKSGAAAAAAPAASTAMAVDEKPV